MIVANPTNQILEAYRVLKPGSMACFTIWGSKEKCLQFSLTEELFERYVTEENREEFSRSYDKFDLYTDDKG